MTLAALEATLRHYFAPQAAVREIPTLHMLTAPLSEVNRRARRLLAPRRAQFRPLGLVHRLRRIHVGVHEFLEAAEVVLGALAQTEVHSARVTDESVTFTP
jgi:seryl-tRNA(Sec) selenium transferase